MTPAQIHELQLSLNHWQGQAVNNQTTANIYKAKSDDLVNELKSSENQVKQLKRQILRMKANANT
tara:strand:+ start:274 stop:468 length:195 start_codon:yes stop_codon:yes gene_type:complete